MKSLFILGFASALPFLVSRVLSVPVDDKLPRPSKEAMAQYKAAKDTHGKLMDDFRTNPHYDGESVYIWSRRLLDAERGVARTRKERVAAFEGHLQRMIQVVADTDMWERKKKDEGTPFRPDQRFRLARTGFYRAEAELMLQQAKKEQR